MIRIIIDSSGSRYRIIDKLEESLIFDTIRTFYCLFLEEERLIQSIIYWIEIGETISPFSLENFTKRSSNHGDGKVYTTILLSSFKIQFLRVLSIIYGWTTTHD